MQLEATRRAKTSNTRSVLRPFRAPNAPSIRTRSSSSNARSFRIVTTPDSETEATPRRKNSIHCSQSPSTRIFWSDS